MNKLLITIGLIVGTCFSMACSNSSDDGASFPEQIGPAPYLLLNEKWVEGTTSNLLDLKDVDAVFWHVFSRLPSEVTIYPSENYYYFILYVGGRQIWGNIRLPAGRRDNGVVSFAYFEHRESPYVTDPQLKNSKFFSDAHGLLLTELDPFRWKMRYKGHEVIFNLHKLNQDQPKLFSLGPDEISVMRTFDESGYQFFLVFNTKDNYLFWVLNEEEIVPDILQPLVDQYVVGRRSGFIFLVDKAHNNRKVLAAIRGANATVNNYYDGPFDQLADNYVDETNISEYLQLASPNLRGRLDKYGYYTDRDGSSRVAVSPYFVYFNDNELGIMVEVINSSDDPYRTISKKGADILALRYPTMPTRYPTPYPTAYPPTPTKYITPTPTG